MSLASQHIVGSESFFSKTSGIGGKLRKKPEDFNVEEVVSIPGRSHWIWMQDSSNGKHQIVKIKDWAFSIALVLISWGAFVLIPIGEKILMLAKKTFFL